MQSVLSIPIVQSGQPVFIPNFLLTGSGSSIQFAYAVNGAPDSLTITVLGLKNASGESPVLDTYTGTTNTTRTISLTDTYDSFLVTATWSGGTSSVGVVVTVTATAGSGPLYQGGFQMIRSGVGSPAGVLAAPVGAVYVALNGTPGAVFFCKTSGGATSAGWTAVA